MFESPNSQFVFDSVSVLNPDPIHFIFNANLISLLLSREREKRVNKIDDMPPTDHKKVYLKNLEATDGTDQMKIQLFSLHFLPSSQVLHLQIQILNLGSELL